MNIKLDNKVVPKLRFKEFRDSWNIVKLKDLTSLITKGTTPESFSNEGVNFVKIEALDGIHIKKENCKHISEETHFNFLQRSILALNDILFAIAGATIGKLGYVSHDILPANTNQALAIIRLNNTNYRDYILQILQSRIMKKYIYKNISVGAQPNLSLKQINDFSFPLPEHKEQNKIAEFLSSVDKKIQLLEKKKELLEEYKKGVMQKIFSREIRFKDSNGNSYPDWERSVLADLFSSKRGQGLSGKNIIEDGKNKCILYGALYTKYDEVIFDVVEKTNEIGSVQSVMGDLLVPASTTTSGIDLANFTALDEDGIYLGGDITIMRSKEKSSNKFWAYYLTHFKKFDVAKYAQGTTIVHLYFNHFKKIKVDVPSYDEQKKIADFILVLDKKIKSTSTLIDKTKEFKKGLLQQMFV